MSERTSLPAALIRAYRETHYGISSRSRLTLVVDQQSHALIDLHRDHDVDCSAFITACNPYSAELSAERNAERQAELARELQQLGLTFAEGVGQHPSNHWPGEPSFLVFGLSLEAAKALGESYEQNAIVWSGADGVPRLILLR